MQQRILYMSAVPVEEQIPIHQDLMERLTRRDRAKIACLMAQPQMGKTSLMRRLLEDEAQHIGIDFSAYGSDGFLSNQFYTFILCDFAEKLSGYSYPVEQLEDLENCSFDDFEAGVTRATQVLGEILSTSPEKVTIAFSELTIFSCHPKKREYFFYFLKALSSIEGLTVLLDCHPSPVLEKAMLGDEEGSAFELYPVTPLDQNEARFLIDELLKRCGKVVQDQGFYSAIYELTAGRPNEVAILLHVLTSGEPGDLSDLELIAGSFQCDWRGVMIKNFDMSLYYKPYLSIYTTDQEKDLLSRLVNEGDLSFDHEGVHAKRLLRYGLLKCTEGRIQFNGRIGEEVMKWLFTHENSQYRRP